MSEKIKGSVRRLHAAEQPDVATHIKMYKANGRWLAVLLFVAGAAVGIQSQSAQAATNPSVTTQQTTTTATVVPNVSTNITSAVTKPQTGPESTIPATSNDTDTVQTATQTVAQTNLGNASAETIETTKQAKTAVYQSTGQPQEITAVDPTASTSVTVDKDNFSDYFTLNGTASYDSSTGILTLTTKDFNQDGNATLKNKVDLTQSFVLDGYLNLGDQAQKPGWKAGTLGGGDGVAFAFHDGNTDEVGGNGASVGIGGLEGAFGWKADTFFNAIDEQKPATNSYATADPKEFGQNPLPKDPDGDEYVYGAGEPFGAFIYTNPNTKNNMVTSYDPTDDPNGKAKTIDQPSGNTFVPINISYDGPTKIMTVKFEGQTWSHPITDWTTQTDAAFLISGGTAGAINLQQFKFGSFTYFTSSSVNVKYVDEDNGNALLTTNSPTYTHADGTSLATGESVQPGDKYATNQVTITGYEFDKMIDNSLPANGILQSAGDNGTVIYGYRHIVPITPDNPHDANPNDLTATSTRTINYVKASDNSQIAEPKLQTVIFTRTGTEDLLTKQVTLGVWTPTGEQALSVVSPFVQGFAPDQETVPEGTLTPGNDQTVTVNYFAIGSDNSDGIQVKTLVDQPLYAITFTLQPSEPNGNPIGTSIQLTGNPGEPINLGSLTDIPGYTLVPNQDLVVPGTTGSIVPVRYQRSNTNEPNTNQPNTNQPVTDTPNTNSPKSNTVPSDLEPSSDKGSATGTDDSAATDTKGGTATQGGTTTSNVKTNQGVASVSTVSTQGSAVSDQTNNKQTANKNTLPQTNENQAQGIASLGFLGILASLFGLVKAKKRRRDF